MPYENQFQEFDVRTLLEYLDKHPK